MTKLFSKPLIAGTLQPNARQSVPQAAQRMEQIRRTLPAPVFMTRGEATNCPHYQHISDRTIDVVVDCLLEELTW